MRIGYIIWLERLNSTILKTQVIELLKKANSKDNNLSFEIVYFCSILDGIRFHENIRRIKNDLKTNNINMIIIPIFTIPKIIDLFFYKWYFAFYPLLISTFFLFLVSKVRKLKILHFRSYPIVYSGIFLKRVYKNLRVIFDTRSSFPEEGVRLKKWKEKSISYRYWKVIESKAIEKSDATIVVNNCMRDTFAYKKINNIKVVPNNVDIDRFTFNREQRENLRNALNIGENTIVLVYNGSLFKDSWNDPENYLEIFEILKNMKIEYMVVFFTHQASDVKEYFRRMLPLESNYIVLDVKYEDMGNYLSIADVGINFMSEADYRLSIKTVEYISIGLPLLTNTNMKALCQLIRKERIGEIIGEEKENAVRKILNNIDYYKKNCNRIKDRYSTDHVSKKYCKIYNEIA